ncbi:monooxygenase [Rhizobium sp. BK602]|uniref:monooxygenase n=1 Tax=Rhizobium sp. BK602 TaxID=2586986 RepID=UPI001608B322|nr:monooxygenase [Rhizobium sp. BK602]MBB3609415.1 alkylation response protein AidB-like acyl-CoA dehydrogenase [Rhizobium sp. BK602]
MTQIDSAWGSGPTSRYDELAERFRPVFDRIRTSAIERDLVRELPHEQIGWLRESGFTTLRLSTDNGGFAATLPELFNLLIELSAADSNVTNALRSHFGFTEDVLNSTVAAWRDEWLRRIAARDLIGSGFSEVGDAKVGTFSTKLTRNGDHWLLNGAKYYTTGSLFADWINLGGNDENGEPIGALVPRQAPGVEVVDDWDGFGQSLTASGTALFSDVIIKAELVTPPGGRFKYSSAFFQLVHLATLAGIGRAAATDVARLVSERKRIYSHGNAPSVSEDPQILQVVGRVRGAAYSAGAIVLKAADALQRAYEQRAADTAVSERANAIAEIEVNQSVHAVTSLILEATTLLFDALGASATKRGLGLDRYWRNARTISSHNPRIYRDRIVGDFAVNGTPPPAQYKIGQI